MILGIQKCEYVSMNYNDNYFCKEIWNYWAILRVFEWIIIMIIGMQRCENVSTYNDNYLWKGIWTFGANVRAFEWIIMMIFGLQKYENISMYNDNSLWSLECKDVRVFQWIKW